MPKDQYHEWNMILKVNPATNTIFFYLFFYQLVIFAKVINNWLKKFKKIALFKSYSQIYYATRILSNGQLLIMAVLDQTANILSWLKDIRTRTTKLSIKHDLGLVKQRCTQITHLPLAYIGQLIILENTATHSHVIFLLLNKISLQ